ncbi:MAG: ferredoxin [Coriobacteriia bacterium]|nr:ferredoxin [Coriobacteriia bacterium]
MKPIVDFDLCIGCGLCEEVCPEVFRLEDDGLAHVIDEEPDEELYGPVREAADSCPVDAISIEE